MRKRKKLLLLFIPVFLVGSLFIFRRQAATFAFKSYLSRYVEGIQASELNFGEVTWEGKGFTIERFHLEKADQYELKIRKLHFAFTGDLYLYRPKFIVHTKEGPALSLKTINRKPSSSKLIMEKGVLETPFSKAHFFYNDNTLRLFSKGEEVTAHFSTPEKRQFLTHVTINEADVPWLFGLIFPFAPTYDLSFESGTITGKLDWLVTKRGETGCGDFSLENLSGKRLDVEFLAERLHIEGAWPNAKMAIEGGHLGLQSGNYQFAHLSGSYENGEAIHFILEGECAHKNLSAPFFIQGQNFGERLFANVLFDRSSMANVEMRGRDFKNCFLKVESPQILTKHVEWLGASIPFVDEISGGRFSGAVSAEIEEGACKEVEATKILGEDCSFRGVAIDELLVTGLISTENFWDSNLCGEFLLKEKGEGNFLYNSGEYTLSVTAPPDLIVGRDKWAIPSLTLDARGEIADGKITSKGSAQAEGEKVDFSFLYDGESLKSAQVASDKISDHFYHYPLSFTGVDIALKGSLALRASYDQEKGVDCELLPLNLTFEDEDFIVVAKEAKIPCHFSIKKKDWKGELILYQADLFEKNSDIHFQNVNGRLFLENGVGYSSWIEAETKGCKVGGVLQFTKERFELRGREFSGNVEGLISFLHHFEGLKELDLPLTGKFQALDEGLIFTQNCGTREVKIALKVEGGYLSLPFDVSAADMSCEIHFNSEKKEFEVKDLTGEVCFFGTPVYGIDGRELNFKGGALTYDLRLSNDVREIVKLEGKGTTPFSYLIDLDLEKSHLFGERFSEGRLELKPNGKIVALHAKVPLLLETVESQVLAHLPELKEQKLEGRVDVELCIEEGGQKAALSAYADQVSLREKEYRDFSTLLIKVGKEMRLDHLRLGKHEIEGEGIWRADQLNVQRVIGFSPHGELTAASGNYNFATKRGELAFSGKRCSLQKILPNLPITMDAKAQLHFDLGNKTIEGDLAVQSHDSPLSFATAEPIQFLYRWKEGTIIQNTSFELDGAKVSVEKVFYRKGEWHCRGVDLSMPPETFHKITHLSPYLDPIPWENQIELSGDFSYGEGGVSALGTIKEGYYWIAKQSFYLDNGAFSMQRGKLLFNLASHLREVPMQLSGEMLLNQNFRTTINLKTEDDLDGVTLIGDWHDGPMIESVQGEFAGQKLHLVGANIPEDLEAIALSGSIEVDFEKLIPISPEIVAEKLRELELSGGYELSGDLIIDRTKPLDFLFQGFLKGRYFGFKGNRFKTLLSEIELTNDRLFLRDLNLSDEAVLMQIDKALFTKVENSWHMSIPTIAVQDFRPSMMRNQHGHEKRLKPFTVRALNIEKLEGNLSDTHSITGRGSLQFINTFKRSNNLLDIPIEIISRLGLDQSILIPVKGDIEFVFDDGEIQFVKLDNCVSEGRHSYFTLSRKQPSYVSLDGKIHVDIKMKQHVLLRFTQPFMLSLRGTLSKPRYSLK